MADGVFVANRSKGSPMSHPDLPWTILFTAMLIGAAGGWAFIISRIIEAVRYWRSVPVGYTDEESTKGCDGLRMWREEETTVGC